jgi:hypothetical protein
LNMLTGCIRLWRKGQERSGSMRGLDKLRLEPKRQRSERRPVGPQLRSGC